MAAMTWEAGCARPWIRQAVLNTLAALMVAAMLTAMGARGSFLAELASSLIFAHTIGVLARLTVPPVARRLDWSRGRRAWLALTATLLAVATVGCVIAACLTVVVGLVPAAELGRVISMSLAICIFITLGFGSGITVYEVTRARLVAAQGELRAREIERERAEKLLAETRLASLESRLHPHFLFNTLNAISALIPEDPERAEKLVEQLAALLRFSLDAGARHVVPLATELEIVRAYLDIEGARLGPRLRAALAPSPDLDACLVPPLALHTLVQNSIKHVAAARREPTDIRVWAEARDGHLRLGVWDPGPPFPLDAMPPGHGLDGLRARLDVLYGDEGSLDVRAVDGGKVVSVSFPLRRDV
jgi:LytS/YehU family sensor histidine kinase